VTAGLAESAPQAAGLTERLRSGAVSATAATEAYLRRSERLDGLLRAFVTVSADTALEQARAADEALERGSLLGPLHGLPVALKDNIDTAGIRTTAGSRFFADRVPPADAEVARRLREAGAVLVGKTQLHEFAYGATTQNPRKCMSPPRSGLRRVPPRAGRHPQGCRRTGGS